jgi:hypothetical protein
MDRAERPQQLLLIGPADDVHKRHPVADAKLDEHLAEVRRRRGVYEG